MKHRTIITYVDEDGVMIEPNEVKKHYKTIKQLTSHVTQYEKETWIYRTVLVRRTNQIGIEFPDD